MLGMKTLWNRYEVWRLGRCREGSAAADLLGASVLLPVSSFMLWRATAPALACGVEAGWVVSGALIFAAGWSSLGRAFWVRLVWRLRSGRTHPKRG